MNNQNIEARFQDEGCYGMIHKVQKGDTLYKLSKQYGIRVSSLMLANPYVNVYSLQIGDELCIPMAQQVAVPETAVQEPIVPAQDDALMLEGSQPIQVDEDFYGEEAEAAPISFIPAEESNMGFYSEEGMAGVLLNEAGGGGSCCGGNGVSEDAAILREIPDLPPIDEVIDEPTPENIAEAVKDYLDQMPVFEETEEMMYQSIYMNKQGLSQDASGSAWPGGPDFDSNTPVQQVLDSTGITMDDFTMSMKNLVQEMNR